MANTNARIALSVLSPLLVLLHFFTILLICTKKVLDRPVYYLILNCSISDGLFTIVSYASIILTDNGNPFVDSLARLFYYSSVITTFLVALDRFIALRYCLRYKSILTNQKLLLTIACSWMVSIMFSLIELIKITLLESNMKQYIRIEIFRYIIYIIFCSGTIALSIHTLLIRNKHIQAINKQQHIFETRIEKNKVLKSLRTSIYDAFKLNVFTSLLILLHTSLSLVLECFWMNKVIYKIVFHLYALHMISNPIVVIMMLTPLQKQYKAILCACTCIAKRNVEPAPTQGEPIELAMREMEPTNVTST